MNTAAKTLERAGFGTTPPEQGQWMLLDNYSVIAVQGEDAGIFLQGQFSNDIDALAPGRCQLNAYCNPKGRVLALTRVLKRDAGFILLVPSDVAPNFIQRLRMFVMRAKVVFDMEDQPVAVGTWGPLTGLPDDAETFQCDQEGFRKVCLVARESLAKFDNDCEAGSDLWKLLDISSGIPQVYSQTVEQFIPQNINLDLVDGVNFRKGCCPGQEIVARVKYRGRSKQRMIAGTVITDASVSPGEPVFVAGEDNRKAGLIIDAVNLGEGTVCVSAVAPSPLETELALMSGDGPRISIVALPYDVEQS